MIYVTFSITLMFVKYVIFDFNNLCYGTDFVIKS